MSDDEKKTVSAMFNAASFGDAVPRGVVTPAMMRASIQKMIAEYDAAGLIVDAKAIETTWDADAKILRTTIPVSDPRTFVRNAVENGVSIEELVVLFDGQLTREEIREMLVDEVLVVSDPGGLIKTTFE